MTNCESETSRSCTFLSRQIWKMSYTTRWLCDGVANAFRHVISYDFMVAVSLSSGSDLLKDLGGVRSGEVGFAPFQFWIMTKKNMAICNYLLVTITGYKRINLIYWTIKRCLIANICSSYRYKCKCIYIHTYKYI